MDALAIALVVAGLVAGLTGTWSPCGFSMIETIGPAGHRGGRTTTLAACAMFFLGALAGGVATFATLGLAGALTHGADQALAYGAAAGIAIAAALAEARAWPILPQVRRQLPEHWRRLMPMPVAAALYGVLLGLGFTTFVLTFGVFALAAITFAAGSSTLGVAVGLGFGLGRALPVVILAPVADRPAGLRATELMAERPAIYRGFRLADSGALLAVAAALAVAIPASASRVEERPAADPSVDGDALAFQRPDRLGVLGTSGGQTALPGRDPAVGGGRAAVIDGGSIVILERPGLGEVARVAAPGADAVAISGTWLVWRARIKGRDFIRARSIANPAAPWRQKSLAGAGRAAQLGRPSVDGNRIVFAQASQRENRILRRTLGAKRTRGGTLLRSATSGLSNPSIRGRRLLYVRHGARADRLVLAKLKRPNRGRVLISRRDGTLWSTALGPRRAYVTLIQGTQPRQRILSAKR
jgi:MFS family permease